MPISLPGGSASSGGATEAKQDTLLTRVGEVQASPTANTVLDRLKALLTGIVLAAGSAIIGKVGIDQTTNGTTNRVNIGPATDGEYETVAASQTAQVIGATGAIGDFINGLLVIPATTSPGNVLLLDHETSITVFAGGASSVSNLVPFFIPLGMKSASGAWKVTTGANVSVIGIGSFT